MNSSIDKQEHQQALFQFFLQSGYINFKNMFDLAVKQRNVNVMRAFLDFQLIHHYTVLTGASDIGDIKLVEYILTNWDCYVNKNKERYEYVPLSDALALVTARGLYLNHKHLITYLFEQDHTEHFGTYYPQEMSEYDDLEMNLVPIPLKTIRYLKPDPDVGLRCSKNLEDIKYFASKGATKFFDCIDTACDTVDLAMLKFVISKCSLSKTVSSNEILFAWSLTTTIEKGYFEFFQYLSPFQYDLTTVLSQTFSGEWYSRNDPRCMYLLIQHINEDINRVDWGWDTHWQGNDITLVFMNYGLSHEVIKKINISEYNRIMARQKEKLLLLKSMFCWMMPNDIFSVLQHFITYSYPLTQSTHTV